MGTITVVCVDDHTLLRDGLRSLLGAAGIDMLAEGATNYAAIALVEQHRPDVLLLDVDLPGPGPEVTLPSIHAASASTRVIMLAPHGDPVAAHAVVRIGLPVRGYLVKDVGIEQLIAAIDAVMHDDGRTVVASSTSSLDDALAQLSRVEQSPLTEQERQALELAARGLTTRTIATTLHTSESTARRWLASSYQKLGAANRLTAVNRAVAAGVIDPPAPEFEPGVASFDGER